MEALARGGPAVEHGQVLGLAVLRPGSGGHLGMRLDEVLHILQQRCGALSAVAGLFGYNPARHLGETFEMQVEHAELDGLLHQAGELVDELLPVELEGEDHAR